jgi:AcrR family transcriptional regulator
MVALLFCGMANTKGTQSPLQLRWIRAGYEQLANLGPSRLHVEALARTVGSSKSSFYHHFVDQELFLAELLEYHRQQVALLSAAEAACTCVDPEIFAVLIQHRMTLLVQRQLLLNSHLPSVAECAQWATETTTAVVIPLFARELGLHPMSAAADAALTLALHDVLMSVHDDNVSIEGLRRHLERLRTLITGARTSQ